MRIPLRALLDLLEEGRLKSPGVTALSVLAVVVGGAVVADLAQGPAMAILLLAGSALISVIALLWGSVRTLLGETPLSGADAYAIGAPRAEEEKKRAVLRALKDLEFERSVGKISEEDYRVLYVKYRTEAKRLLRILEEEAQPRRQGVEAMIQKRLRREGLDAELGEAASPEPTPSPEEVEVEVERKGRRKKKGQRPAATAEARPAKPAPAEAKPAKPAPAAADNVCPECATVNEADAVFCKKCGTNMTVAPANDDGGDASTGAV
jgi:hypothetical protein